MKAGTPVTPVTAGSRRAIATGLLVLTAAALVASLVLGAGAPRAALTVLAALTVPGGALSARMTFATLRQAAAAAVGLSLAAETVLALAMVWTSWWHPAAVAAGLMAISTAALAFDLVRPEPAVRT
jgi:uncharacterized membrane protein